MFSSMVANRHGVPVTSSIPQRSVPGPMLFVCYINDMPDVVDSPIHMFADGTKIFRQMTAQSAQVALQTDLRQLEAWTRKCVIRRSFIYLDGPTMKKLYMILVRNK